MVFGTNDATFESCREYFKVVCCDIIVKEIELTQGQVALVDDEDYDWINSYRWYANKNSNGNYYAVRKMPNNNNKIIRMHRVIIQCPDGKIVDHIDGNSLNNQRKNLRITNHRINAINTKKRRNNKCSSKYPGVCKKNTKKWVSSIMINGKSKHLGYFDTEKEAFLRYIEECNKLKGP